MQFSLGRCGGGGGDDINIMLEYGNTLAWSCAARAWV